MKSSKDNLGGLVIKEASTALSVQELLKRIGDLNKKGVIVQVFHPDAVIDRMHLVVAFTNAQSAFKNHTNRSKSPAMEMLLFASMSNQIGHAIKLMGVRSSSRFILFSSSKAAFGRLRPSLGSAKEFEPRAEHVSAAARLHKINWMRGNPDLEIMQRMALSGLGD